MNHQFSLQYLVNGFINGNQRTVYKLRKTLRILIEKLEVLL